jgi:hypothetical protein
MTPPITRHPDEPRVRKLGRLPRYEVFLPYFLPDPDDDRAGVFGTCTVVWGKRRAAARAKEGGHPTIVRAYDELRQQPSPSAPVCGLCGYWAGGGFWTPIPHHPDAIMHTMGCGPAFPGWQQIAAPTHERLDDGTYRRVPS